MMELTLREELNQRIQAGLHALEIEEKVERRFDEIQEILNKNKDTVWIRDLKVSNNKKVISYIQYLVILSLDKESLTAKIKIIGDTVDPKFGFVRKIAETGVGLGIMNLRLFDPTTVEDWNDFLDDDNPTIFGTARAYFFQYLPD
ncbi:MAG: hypothetical protein IJ880_04275 [Bacilli bacterium]|nr:hypothetical protein [Bacilli bacterium]